MSSVGRSFAGRLTATVGSPQGMVLLAAVLFGTTGTAKSLGPDDVGSVTMGAARIVIGAALLVVFAHRSSGRRWWTSLWWPATVVGGLAVAIYQSSFFAAVGRTGVAVATVVALGSAPAFSGLLGAVLLRERPSRLWYPSTALAILGGSLIALSTGSASADAGGVLLALISGLGYAAYTLTGKMLLNRGAPPDSAMAGLFALGAVALVPVFFLRPLGGLFHPGALAVAVYLGVIPTALAYRLFARGLTQLTASTVTTLTLAEPATAVALGAIVLGERPSLQAWVGIGAILGGLALLAVPTGPNMVPSSMIEGLRDL